MSTGNKTTECAVMVDPKVFLAVPSYSRVVVSASVANPNQGAERILRELAEIRTRIAESYDDAAIADITEIAAWRVAFRAVGINPSKFRPAIEALVRRAIRGDELTFGVPLIDLGTAISLMTRCPIGMHTMPDDAKSLELRPARGDEIFIPFSGEPELPDPGELVYVTDNRVLTRRWAWRQGAVGSIVDGPVTRLAINIDLVDTEHSESAPKQLYEALAWCGAADLAAVHLTASNPSATLRWRQA